MPEQKRISLVEITTKKDFMIKDKLVGLINENRVWLLAGRTCGWRYFEDKTSRELVLERW